MSRKQVDIVLIGLRSADLESLEVEAFESTSDAIVYIKRQMEKHRDLVDTDGFQRVAAEFRVAWSDNTLHTLLSIWNANCSMQIRWTSRSTIPDTYTKCPF
jgi:hypothetical protein